MNSLTGAKNPMLRTKFNKLHSIEFLQFLNLLLISTLLSPLHRKILFVVLQQCFILMTLHVTLSTVSQTQITINAGKEKDTF